LANGEISEAAYEEGLQKVREGLISNLSSLNELDKSMFGFTNAKMSVEYFNTHLSNINTSDALFKESELRLGVKRIRRMYEINKGDKSTYRILFSMLYIFISGLFILTLFAL
jgi:hypothetical protein